MLTPGKMKELGDAVVEAAADVDVKMIKGQLAKFAAVHNKWSAAYEAAAAATAAKDAGEQTLTALDEAQDKKLDALVAALARDGFDRLAPFKGLVDETPTTIKRMKKSAEALVASVLAVKVKATRQAGELSRKAATDLEKTAKELVATAKRVAPLAKTAAVRIAKRDALAPEWLKALSTLKLAAKLAETEGAGPLLRTLFPKPKSKKSAEPASPT